MGFLLVQFTVWKWEISNVVDGLSFHLVIAKLKYMRTWNFLRNAHFQHVWDEAKFLKIGLIPLEIEDFCWESLLVESGKFQIFSIGYVFNLTMQIKTPAHLKFTAQMPTFNAFEMKQSFWKSGKYLWRYRIFAGTVYMLKVENFKTCRCAKFSPCHCKSKIPAHLKFSA